MTVAELIQKLQNFDVDPNTNINFIVNLFNKTEVASIYVMKYTRVMPDGSWKPCKEINFHLQSDDLES